MYELYPDIKPYAVHRLVVDDIHSLYVEECGNHEGVPVVFLHGGPGAGCEAWQRCFFDPERYRIVLFDQRGCGRSTPHAELTANTTAHLLADIEQLRELLNIERWLVFGGSWGSTLALAYAQQYPQRVSGLILRGIFLGRQQDIDWMYRSGANRLFPDAWERFLEPLNESEYADPVAAYQRRLNGVDELERLRAARGWSLWEAALYSLTSKVATQDHFGATHVALSLARIENHYVANHLFLEDNQLLRDAGRLAGIPGTIVQGRYDVICPMEQAWVLHRAWPDAELFIVPAAGHAASEAGVIDGLVRATRAYASSLA